MGNDTYNLGVNLKKATVKDVWSIYVKSSGGGPIIYFDDRRGTTLKRKVN